MYVLCLTVRVFIIYEMVNVGDSCFMKFVVGHRGIFFDSSFVKLISHDTVKHHLLLSGRDKSGSERVAEIIPTPPPPPRKQNNNRILDPT